MHHFIVSRSQSQLISLISTNQRKMISPKKLIKMARKWQKMAAIRRKRISLSTANWEVNNTTSGSGSSPLADRGHFVVYPADQRRFVFPIAYLNNEIFKELLKLSEEEFGLPSDGPITLPCDAIFMDYVVSLLQRRAAEDVLQIANRTRCSMSCSLHQEKPGQQLFVCSL